MIIFVRTRLVSKLCLNEEFSGFIIYWFITSKKQPSTLTSRVNIGVWPKWSRWECWEVSTFWWNHNWWLYLGGIVEDCLHDWLSVGVRSIVRWCHDLSSRSHIRHHCWFIANGFDRSLAALQPIRSKTLFFVCVFSFDDKVIRIYWERKCVYWIYWLPLNVRYECVFRWRL